MFHQIATWSVGAMNGFLVPDGGLPASYKWGAIALASGMHMTKIVGSLELPLRTPPKSIGASLLIAPVWMGALFCSGSFVGKSGRAVLDRGVKNTNAKTSA